MPNAATERAMEAEPAEASLREQIALLAFQLWRQRGCPEGSPEEDWFLAESALTAQANEDLA
jgi:Protein of unknown function (DUF2934)